MYKFQDSLDAQEYISEIREQRKKNAMAAAIAKDNPTYPVKPHTAAVKDAIDLLNYKHNDGDKMFYSSYAKPILGRHLKRC